MIGRRLVRRHRDQLEPVGLLDGPPVGCAPSRRRSRSGCRGPASAAHGCRRSGSARPRSWRGRRATPPAGCRGSRRCERRGSSKSYPSASNSAADQPTPAPTITLPPDERVERRERVRQGERVVLRQHEDARSEADALGDRGGPRQRHERLEEVRATDSSAPRGGRCGRSPRRRRSRAPRRVAPLGRWPRPTRRGRTAGGGSRSARRPCLVRPRNVRRPWTRSPPARPGGPSSPTTDSCTSPPSRPSATPPSGSRGRDGYFASRAAAMGAVSAEVVDRHVLQLRPSGWCATPSRRRGSERRRTGGARGGEARGHRRRPAARARRRRRRRRRRPPERPSSPALALAACTPDGRPLAAAHAVSTRPSPPTSRSGTPSPSCASSAAMATSPASSRPASTAASPSSCTPPRARSRRGRPPGDARLVRRRLGGGRRPAPCARVGRGRRLVHRRGTGGSGGDRGPHRRARLGAVEGARRGRLRGAAVPRPPLLEGDRRRRRLRSPRDRRRRSCSPAGAATGGAMTTEALERAFASTKKVLAGVEARSARPVDTVRVMGRPPADQPHRRRKPLVRGLDRGG